MKYVLLLSILDHISTGSKSFGKTTFTANKMCTTIFKKLNVQLVKMEALHVAWTIQSDFENYQCNYHQGGGGDFQ